MSVDLILWILALVCFLIGAARLDTTWRVNIVALGLALAALTFIVG